MVAPMNDRDLDAYCHDWAKWCATRNYYLRPGAQNILARMQPHRSGREPNARNDPNMQFFNMAVHALADMPEHAEALACFNLMYAVQAEHIKREANKLGIARSTYYRRATAFARKAYSMSLSIKKVYIQNNSEMKSQA